MSVAPALTVTKAPPRRKRAAGTQGGRVNTLPLVAPSVVLLLMWSLVPLALTLFFSFRRYNLLNPAITGWAGVNNYQFLFQDPALFAALWNTVVLVGSVLVITVCLGAVLAALFETEFPGRGIARVLMISPFFVMPTVSALIWKNLLMQPVNGPVRVLGAQRRTGADRLVHRPADGLRHPHRRLAVVALRIPQLDDGTAVARRANTGGGTVGRRRGIVDLRACAGAALGARDQRRRADETIFLLGVFAEIYVTTSGGPGTATTNLAF